MAAAGAFEEEFRRPEMVDTLHELLNLAERSATFARVESMFQSSGWGKSRTICELWRRDVWVVYCSLGQGSGYPLRSAMASWFLERTSSVISADLDGQLRCMAFCLAYFEAALTELLNLATADPALTPQRFVRMMYKSGEGAPGGEEAAGGARFWQLVKDRMASLLLEYEAENLLTAQGRTRGDCWNDWEARAAIRMDPVIEQVRSKLLGGELSGMDMDIDRSSPGVQVLFVFDEARILVPDILDKNVYLPLRRSTSSFVNSGVFVLFSDTAARISNLCAPIWMDPSDRMPGTNLTRATPIWSCFWADHGVADWSLECVRRGISDRDVLSEYWPLRYGRPLWWYMFKSKGLGGKKRALDMVVRLACDKLLGGSGGYAKHVEGKAPLTPEMALAVLGCRCAVSIDPRCSAVSTLVASYLMTVVKVDDSREYLYADWPMEPIVAGAAARIMHALHAQQRATKELYFPLGMALKNAWISKGYRGELSARIILQRAFDRAAHKARQTFCTLDAFIQELLGTSLLNLIAEQTGEAPSESVKELASSKLCFTSFHKIHKRSYELTVEDLKAAAERWCAVVAEDYTWGDDHFITNEAGEVKVHNQVKTRVCDTSIAELAKESPPFCTSCFLSLHTNVLSMEDKVTVVDPTRVEHAVRSNRGNKVVRAVLDWEAEQRGEKEGGRRHWSEYQKRFPRLFGAWQSWLAMPRKSQVIVKVKGLGAFKHLVDQDLLELLRDMSTDTSPLDPSHPFQSLQKESVASMFPDVDELSQRPLLGHHSWDSERAGRAASSAMDIALIGLIYKHKTEAETGDSVAEEEAAAAA